MTNTTSRIGVPLPVPPSTYEVNYMGNLLQTLSQNDALVQKVTQDYITYGFPNIDTTLVSEINQRLILISPNGTYFQILVDDAGALTTLNLGT